MARIRVNDYIDIACKGYHNASTYQVALDPEFTQIIDETIEDKVNVEYWDTMLPKLDGTGYYADLDQLYARVKVHIDNTVSPWFTCEPKTQRYQLVTITYPDGTTELTDSSALGWYS